MFDLNTFFRQTVNLNQQTVQCIQERIDLGQLAADVAVHTDHVQVFHGIGFFVDADCFVDIYTELVLFQAGGDVGVCTRIHVRVNTQGDRRYFAHLCRYGVDTIQFWLRLPR